MAPTKAAMPAVTPVPFPEYPTLQVTHSLILFATALHATGAATIIAGVVGRKTLLWKGIFQLLLTPLIVGIVWSIVSQYRLLKNAQAAEGSA